VAVRVKPSESRLFVSVVTSDDCLEVKITPRGFHVEVSVLPEDDAEYQGDRTDLPGGGKPFYDPPPPIGSSANGGPASSVLLVEPSEVDFYQGLMESADTAMVSELEIAPPSEEQTEEPLLEETQGESLSASIKETPLEETPLEEASLEEAPLEEPSLEEAPLEAPKELLAEGALQDDFSPDDFNAEISESVNLSDDLDSGPGETESAKAQTPDSLEDPGLSLESPEEEAPDSLEDPGLSLESSEEETPGSLEDPGLSLDSSDNLDSPDSLEAPQEESLDSPQEEPFESLQPTDDQAFDSLELSPAKNEHSGDTLTPMASAGVELLIRAIDYPRAPNGTPLAIGRPLGFDDSPDNEDNSDSYNALEAKKLDAISQTQAFLAQLPDFAPAEPSGDDSRSDTAQVNLRTNIPDLDSEQYPATFDSQSSEELKAVSPPVSEKPAAPDDSFYCEPVPGDDLSLQDEASITQRETKESDDLNLADSTDSLKALELDSQDGPELEEALEKLEQDDCLEKIENQTPTTTQVEPKAASSSRSQSDFVVRYFGGREYSFLTQEEADAAEAAEARLSSENLEETGYAEDDYDPANYSDQNSDMDGALEEDAQQELFDELDDETPAVFESLEDQNLDDQNLEDNQPLDNSEVDNPGIFEFTDGGHNNVFEFPDDGPPSSEPASLGAQSEELFEHDSDPSALEPYWEEADSQLDSSDYDPVNDPAKNLAGDYPQDLPPQQDESALIPEVILAPDYSLSSEATALLQALPPLNALPELVPALEPFPEVSNMPLLEPQPLKFTPPKPLPKPKSKPEASTAVIVNYLEDSEDSFVSAQGQAGELSDEDDLDIDLMDMHSQEPIRFVAKPMIPAPKIPL
jgi:hypothetical protein